MGEEETLLAVKEALAYLRRIERLLETMAENLQEYLETSRQLLASPALKADVAQVSDHVLYCPGIDNQGVDH